MAVASKQAERTYLSRIIGATPMFHSAAADDIAELARCARSVALARGKTPAGAKGKLQDIYIIEKGAAALLDRDPATGRAILIALLGPGDIIGLVSAAEALAGIKESNNSEWRAVTNLTVVAIPIADFIRVARRSGELTAAWQGTIAHSLRKVTARFSAALLHPLEMRLAAFLGQLGAIAAGNNWEPTANLGRLQQTQIAEMLGVSREHVNRTLIMWEKSGLIFQSKAGDLVIENRKRLAQLAGTRRTPGGIPSENDWLWEIESHINLGLNVAAYDLAMEGAKRAPRDDRFKYYAVLAMARMGSPAEALSLAETFKLTTDAANEDIASIGPRLRRDLAFASDGPPDKAQLDMAAAGFEKVFRTLDATYPGVNAASTYAMGGDIDQARQLAKEVSAKVAGTLADIDDDEPSYWPRATLAECRLIAGDLSGAAAEFAAAAAAPDAAPGKVATTRKQLRRLQGALSLKDEWVDEILPQGRVLYFCGPLTPSNGATQAALSRLKERFNEFLRQNRFVAAIGALAAGADIIFAEAALDAGIPLHAHLPLPPTEFLAASVAPAGADWKERYISCVERAQTIDWMRRAHPSIGAYRLGARIAMGRAMRQATELATEPFGYFALQSGRTARNSVSIENAEIWKSLGLQLNVIEDDWLSASAAPRANGVQSYLAALIIQGASDAAMKEADRAKPLFVTRTDGLAVFAFGTAQEVFDAARRIARTGSGAGARLWLDVGVGDEKEHANFAASLVTASCRPQTAPGRTYASDNFVNTAISTPGPLPKFDYVGFAPTEEKLDPCPLYLTDI